MNNNFYKYRIIAVSIFLLISGFSFLQSPTSLVNEQYAEEGDANKQREAGMKYLKKRYSTNYRCNDGQFTSFLCRYLDDSFSTGKRMDTIDRGIYWLRQAVEKGDNESKYYLALALQGEYYPSSHMKDVAPEKLKEARALLHQLADNGHVESSYKLGWYYLRAIGGEVDIDCAIYYLSFAYNNGNSNASALLEIAKNEKEANKSLNQTGANSAPPG